MLTPVCTKSFVGCGFAPDLTGAAYSATPDPLAVFIGGLFLKGGKGKGNDRGRQFVLCPRRKKVGANENGHNVVGRKFKSSKSSSLSLVEVE